jgi:hypothetical protein
MAGRLSGVNPAFCHWRFAILSGRGKEKLMDSVHFPDGELPECLCVQTLSLQNPPFHSIFAATITASEKNKD